jgi:hypothetical protein
VPPAAGAAATVADADPRAVEIARRVLERLGGQEAWDATRHVRWRFFGGRLHHWDKQTGDIRIDSPARQDRKARTVLMNIHTRRGRAWEEGREFAGADLDQALDLAHQWWVNDSYWMFMPYKLLDPGVRLRALGERPLPDGRAADVIELTFAPGIGYTPENKYDVWVARDTGLVEQWSYYERASDPEPEITDPWSGWRQFGRIWLATAHGRPAEWDIAVFDELPPVVYRDPAPVAG